LRPQIAAVVGPGITLIDTGEAVAKQVARRLPPTAAESTVADERFWTTGDAGSARRIIGRLWGKPATVQAL
jgi:glutamate racemase